MYDTSVPVSDTTYNWPAVLPEYAQILTKVV
jgi:hypothetical protein